MGHLLMNMFGLWGFGASFLYIYGPWAYIATWVGAGVGGGALGVWNAERKRRKAQEEGRWKEAMTQVVSYGASASVLGLVTALGMASPRQRIQIMFIVSIFDFHTFRSSSIGFMTLRPRRALMLPMLTCPARRHPKLPHAPRLRRLQPGRRDERHNPAVGPRGAPGRHGFRGHILAVVAAEAAVADGRQGLPGTEDGNAAVGVPGSRGGSKVGQKEAVDAVRFQDLSGKTSSASNALGVIGYEIGSTKNLRLGQFERV